VLFDCGNYRAAVIQDFLQCRMIRLFPVHDVSPVRLTPEMPPRHGRTDVEKEHCPGLVIDIELVTD